MIPRPFGRWGGYLMMVAVAAAVGGVLWMMGVIE